MKLYEFCFSPTGGCRKVSHSISKGWDCEKLFVDLTDPEGVWPIPEKEITANNKGQLWQNYGYTGYDANIPVWDNWEDAVADQDVVD